MILWDVSLYLYFIFVIEDTVSFKFGGVCVGIRVDSMLFVYFYFRLAQCFFVYFYFILFFLCML